MQTSTNREHFRQTVRQALTEYFRLAELRGEICEDIASDKYKGIEIKQLVWLLKAVPNECKDRDELASQIRADAIDAARIYDPKHGAKFSTFLTDHLRMKCQALQNYLWVRSSGNQHCRMLPFLPDTGGSRSAKYDRDPQSTAIAVRGDAEASAQTSECIAALSDESREALAAILAAMPENESAIIAAIRGKHFRKKLLDLAGVPREHSAKLFSEVRSKLPDYL